MTSIDLDDHTAEEESGASPPMSLFQHLYQSPPATAIAPPSARLPAASTRDDDGQQGPRFKDQTRPDFLQHATLPDAIEAEEEEQVQRGEEEQVREEHLVDAEIPMVSALWVTDSQIRLEDQDQLKLERQQLDLERQQLELERQQRQQLEEQLEQQRQELEEQLEQQRQVLEQLLGVTNQPPQPPPPPPATTNEQQQQEPTTVAENGGSGSKKRWIARTIVAAIVVCFLAGGGAAAFVGICGTSGNCRGSSPQTRSSSIHSYINIITLTGRSLRYPHNSTAEERALMWLIDVDRFTNESDMVALRQRYALATIWFQSPTGFGSSGWVTGISECAWYGVSCDAAGRLVTYLSPIGNIGGQIPVDLGLLTALTFLGLGAKALEGSIPTSLGSLTALNVLYLNGNALEGTIPSSIGSLTAVTYLNLNDNKLEGTIPSSIGLLTALTELYFSDTVLTGTIPTSIGFLTALSVLGLNSNALTGTIPTTIASLTALNVFRVHNNGLTGTMPFCVSVSNRSFDRLVADCDKVSCHCCTSCCPTRRDGIPVYFAC